ncbi:hypothetical protein QJS83_13205 [Bdellovibrio sp. 22V]|uniref:hypothetical protein n=1 Tax=Bdellovibrio TaxID=958 RepID=UPI0025432A76|nr:hypothetical protein [Bdellovibrio sp. 22V]WII71421.1 hypothetical protein QJS83_13205 [Bdellovibrio sp. 22V]
MSKAQFTIQNLPQHLLLEISGIIDEHVDFPELVLAENRDVLVDLSRFESINSVGIRSWIEWISKQKFRWMFLQKCPRVFIDQVNNVHGFLPENSVILSFYAPYYSEVTDEEAQILFRQGEHFSKGKIIEMPFVLDSDLNRMSLDVFPEKYLRFLPRFTR